MSKDAPATHSSSCGVEDINFTDSSGNESSWVNAVRNDKIQAYAAYYTPIDSNGQGKYKYTSTSAFNVDDTELRKGKGYWVYAREEGNLTLPNVGGSVAGQTYRWDKLRFSNGTSELNITDAGSAGWISSNLQYWNNDLGAFRYIDNSGNSFTKNYLDSLEGVFVYSYLENITLVRQN